MNTQGNRSKRKDYCEILKAFLLAIVYAVSLTGPAVKASGFKPVFSASDITALAVNAPVERTMAGGETHLFKVALEPGQYLLVTAKQQGVDLTAALVRPDGQPIAQATSPYSRYGWMSVSTVAETGGEYRIEIRARDKNAPSGSYRIVVEALRAPTQNDLSRLNAERLFREARAIRQQQNVETLPTAIEKYTEAMPYWKSAGDRRGEALTLFCQGEAYLTLSQFQQAIEYYQQAKSVNEELADLEGKAYALKDLGLTYMRREDYLSATTYLEQALPIAIQIGNAALKGTTINILGGAYDNLGEPERALQYYQQALEIRRSQGNLRAQTSTLINIGSIYDQVGESQMALDYYNQSLVLLDSLENLSIEEQGRRGIALGNTGFVYDALGDRERALIYYNKALPIAIKTGDRRYEALLLMNIGQIHASEGKTDEALKFYGDALTIRQGLGDRVSEAQLFTYIGQAYASSGRPREALNYYEKASGIHSEFHNRYLQADLLVKVGEAHLLLREHGKAQAAFNRSLPIWQAMNNQRGEASALYGLARLARDAGNLVEARRHSEEAISRIESLRKKIASQEHRATYLASVRDLYELNIDLLLKLDKLEPGSGHDARAFHASERARSRSLLDLLTEAGVDIRQGVDQALIERERRFRQQLNYKAERQMKLLSDKHTEEQKAAAEKELTEILTQYGEVQAQIRAKSPRYAALTQPAPLKLAEVQQRVIDPESLLLEYSLGEERSYLWAVTQTAVTTYELPGRKAIEDAAKRVHEMLSASRQLVQGETLVQRRGRLARLDKEYWPEASRLSDMLLGQVSGQLGNKRLVIVSEGAVQYIPFSALPTPGPQPTQQTANGYKLLIEDHEIVNLPSASALAVLRQEVASRKRAPKSVAVLADPVFEKDDARIKAATKTAKERPEARPSQKPHDSVVAGLRDGFALRRLQASGDEARAIIAVAPAGDTLCALGLDATLERANSGELSQYRIIHFATHGLVNNKHPELSAIALSLLNKNGDPQPGFLRLHDIYNLDLAADLVVLSACDTGLGKDIRGEGLVGLTRGFMYAGAARVVASLWKVDDEATAELMSRFYQKLLKEQMRPATALRAAQIEMLKDKRWGSPFYWSAFILQGEWK